MGPFVHRVVPVSLGGQFLVPFFRKASGTTEDAAGEPAAAAKEKATTLEDTREVWLCFELVWIRGKVPGDLEGVVSHQASWFEPLDFCRRGRCPDKEENIPLGTCRKHSHLEKNAAPTQVAQISSLSTLGPSGPKTLGFEAFLFGPSLFEPLLANPDPPWPSLGGSRSSLS